MDPNQQPQNPNQGGYPPQPPQPVQPNAQPPNFTPQPQPQYGQPAPLQPQQYTPPKGYGPQPAAPPQQSDPFGNQATPTYAVDYLDQIAPPPPRAKLLSGSFGKIVIVLGVVVVLAVSLVVTFSGTSKTGDLESVVVKLDNLQKVSAGVKKYIKDGDLRATNSNFTNQMLDASTNGYSLLAKAGVQKSKINKDTIAKEQAKAKDLSAKFDDARLNAELDRVYAREMAYQAKLLVTALNSMAKKSQSAQIRSYAKDAATNFTPDQKDFADFNEDATSATKTTDSDTTTSKSSN